MFLRASLALHQATGEGKHLQRAVDVVRRIHNLFGAVDGGYYDVAASDATLAGAPLVRERPVLENALLAESLAVMGCLSGNEEYRNQASETLETFKSIVPGSSFLGPRQSRRVEQDEGAALHACRFGLGQGAALIVFWSGPPGDRGQRGPSLDEEAIGGRAEDLRAPPGCPDVGPRARPGTHCIPRVSGSGRTRAVCVYEQYVPGAHSFGSRCGQVADRPALGAGRRSNCLEAGPGPSVGASIVSDKRKTYAPTVTAGRRPWLGETFS